MDRIVPGSLHHGVRKCPQCGSSNYDTYMRQIQIAVVLPGVQMWERCHDCNWRGSPEDRQNYVPVKKKGGKGK